MSPAPIINKILQEDADWRDLLVTAVKTQIETVSGVSDINTIANATLKEKFGIAGASENADEDDDVLEKLLRCTSFSDYKLHSKLVELLAMNEFISPTHTQANCSLSSKDSLATLHYWKVLTAVESLSWSTLSLWTQL